MENRELSPFEKNPAAPGDVYQAIKRADATTRSSASAWSSQISHRLRNTCGSLNFLLHEHLWPTVAVASLVSAALGYMLGRNIRPQFNVDD